MLAQRHSATFNCLRRTGAKVRGTSPSVRLCQSRARTIGHDRPCSVAIGRGRSAQFARSRQVAPDRDRWVRTSASSQLPLELVERGGGGKGAGVDLRCDPQPLGCSSGDHAAGIARRPGLAARRGAGHSSTMRREMAESSPNELLTKEEGQLGHDRAFPCAQLPAAPHQTWRPQRDSKRIPAPNHRRNLSAKRAKTTTCPRSQRTGVDGSRRWTGTVRGQLRDNAA